MNIYSWPLFLSYLMLWICGFAFADAFFEVIRIKPHSKMLITSSAFLLIAIIYQNHYEEESRL